MNARAVLSALGTVIAIAAATVVWHDLPTSAQVLGPFDVHAPIGTPAEGRGVTAKVTAAQLASTVVEDPSQRSFEALGTWVVVWTTLQSGPNFEYYHADLRVGPNTYAPTDRLFPAGLVLQPGIAEERQWAFDVPADLLATVPSVVLRVWVGSDSLDSRLILDIPLGSERVERVQSAVVSAPVRVAL